MEISELEPGDMVFAASTIINDGTLPDLEDGAVIASNGTRGVLINTGYLEEQPTRTLFLVRFENINGELGPATACWPEELKTAHDGA